MGENKDKTALYKKKYQKIIKSHLYSTGARFHSYDFKIDKQSQKKKKMTR